MIVLDMDIEEWEFLSDDGFLDFNEDGEKQNFHGKRTLVPKGVFDMDDFCPSPPSSRKITEPPRSPRVHNQLDPVPILLEQIIGNAPDSGLVKDISKNYPMQDTVVTPSSATNEKIKASNTVASVASDHETASQAFIKIKENEFVNMKMDSPKSSSRGLLPPMDTGALKFEDKSEAMEIITSPRMKIEKNMLSMGCDEEDDSTWEEENAGAFNIWKWSLTGVGAICSFGVVAAATLCILLLGSHQRWNKLQQDQKIQFQIYTDDKGIKQVVQQHATKFSEPISAVTGVPISRAHKTIEGYCEEACGSQECLNIPGNSISRNSNIYERHSLPMGI